MAPIPEWGYAGGQQRLRRAVGRWVGRAASVLRRVAFWVAVLLGGCLPVVLLFEPTLGQVSGLCLLAAAALFVGRSHRPG